MKKLSKNNIITIALIIAIYAIVFVLEKVIDTNSMLFIVLKKGAIYALVAVSMNLLNGFTGLFSLGQAGFMLIHLRNIHYTRGVQGRRISVL